MVLFAPTATVMFGALLGRVADPYALMGAFHVLYVVVSTQLRLRAARHCGWAGNPEKPEGRAKFVDRVGPAGFEPAAGSRARNVHADCAVASWPK